MLKESHGWNLFKKMLSSWKEELFIPQKVEEEFVSPGTKIQTRTYKDVYVGSTDYVTATDFQRHDVSEIIGGLWMRKCGIPKILRGIVIACCYKPRKIEFYAEGILEKIGRRSEVDGVNFITTRRGVLMGDPLTKPVLHLINIAVRVLASSFFIKEKASKIFKNPEEVLEFYSQLDTKIRNRETAPSRTASRTGQV
jgi:hypothetical protein